MKTRNKTLKNEKIFALAHACMLVTLESLAFIPQYIYVHYQRILSSLLLGAQVAVKLERQGLLDICE